MKRRIIEVKESGALLVLGVSLVTSCIHGSIVMPFPEDVLSRMRADTAWIRELDSLAGIAIGIGAECIDPVQHTFSYSGRTWFFNEDWGGVLEIPADFLPEDDIVQTELSFHGTRAFSPDSSVCVSFQAAFLAEDFDGYCKALVEKMGEGSLITVRDEHADALTLQGRREEGTCFWSRHAYCGENGVLFSVLVWYTEGKEEEAARVIGMAERYPAGPGGVIFRGLCLQDIPTEHEKNTTDSENERSGD